MSGQSTKPTLSSNFMTGPRRPLEATVAFWRLQPSTHPNTAGPLRRPRPIPTTIDWHDSLTNKVIKSMQLRRRIIHAPFVLLSMGDGSVFRLEFSRDGRTNRGQLSAVGIITRVSGTTDFTSTPWINVEFAQDSKSSADFRFVISVCCGVLTLLDSATSMTDYQCQLLFALALATSIVRRCLPVHNQLVGSTGTLLDEFWAQISSLTRIVGESLWEECIADKRREEVRRWIYIAAMDQIDNFIPGTPVANQPARSNPGNANDRWTIAASVTAWLEFSSYKHEVASLASWDAEWDRTWRAEWGKNWEDSLNKQAVSSKLRSLHKLENLWTRFFITAVNGGSPGRIAGRAAVDVAVVGEAAVISHKSLLALETTYILQPNRQGSTLAEKNVAIDPKWFEAWCSIRHPNSKQKLLPVWEAASNLAWALAWKKANFQKERFELAQEQMASALNTTEVTARWKVVLSPAGEQDNTSTFNRDIFNARDFQKLAHRFQDIITFQTHDQTPKVEAPPSNTGIEIDIEKLSKAAWQEAQINHSIAEENLQERARGALELAIESGDIPDHVAKSVSSRGESSYSMWEELFIMTWKKTWKICWERAWVKVMNDTMDKMTSQAIQMELPTASSMREHQDAKISSLLSDASESYQEVKNYITGGSSQEECYWRIRSMFKALDLLNKALDHSIPTSHRETMKINLFPDRVPALLLPTSTGRKGATNEYQEQAQELTHAKFQEEIRKLINAKWPSKNQGNVISLINEAWKIAVETNADPHFMGNDDPEPREVFNTTVSPRAVKRRQAVLKKWDGLVVGTLDSLKKLQRPSHNLNRDPDSHTSEMHRDRNSA